MFKQVRSVSPILASLALLLVATPSSAGGDIVRFGTAGNCAAGAECTVQPLEALADLFGSTDHASDGMVSPGVSDHNPGKGKGNGQGEGKNHVTVGHRGGGGGGGHDGGGDSGGDHGEE